MGSSSSQDAYERERWQRDMNRSGLFDAHAPVHREIEPDATEMDELEWAVATRLKELGREHEEYWNAQLALRRYRMARDELEAVIEAVGEPVGERYPEDPYEWEDERLYP